MDFGTGEFLEQMKGVQGFWKKKGWIAKNQYEIMKTFYKERPSLLYFFKHYNISEPLYQKLKNSFRESRIILHLKFGKLKLENQCVWFAFVSSRNDNWFKRESQYLNYQQKYKTGAVSYRDLSRFPSHELTTPYFAEFLESR